MFYIEILLKNLVQLGNQNLALFRDVCRMESEMCCALETTLRAFTKKGDKHSAPRVPHQVYALLRVFSWSDSSFPESRSDTEGTQPLCQL